MRSVFGTWGHWILCCSRSILRIFLWETNHRPSLNDWKLNLKAFISPWIWKGLVTYTFTFSSVVMPTQCYLRWNAISHWTRPDLIPSPCSGSLWNVAQSKQVFLNAHWAFQLLLHFIAKGFSKVDTIPLPLFLSFLSIFTYNLLFITKTFWHLEG